ncbi:uncharacterized protein LOC106132131 [Amyelois transitella]|uniref:uncharacterized protein LOC106132131 n=1 Tax=Amyelois transitella TaxID=680683 RepID=UPI00067D506E|nr:uncharacterized protein LOC106132131 [Amyelois transitella]
MELLTNVEIASIAKQCGYRSVIDWSLEDLSDKVIGYLGDHLKLNIVVLFEGNQLDLKLFVKCMPRFDKWKAEYLKELSFFKKEFVMLSELFKEFPDKMGLREWRPKLYFIRNDLFVFEDVTQQGYKMPNHLEPMDLDDIITTVKTIARFHSESILFEERKSKSLGRSYSIWEDYKDYLQEPDKGKSWRDTGRNAVIDFLKEYSSFKTFSDFIQRIETVIPKLFDDAITLMAPKPEERNVIVHRDLWTNNILIKREYLGSSHAVIVDFQTVLYCCPMLDLSSLIYFNTTKLFRKKYTQEIINIYYETLSEELKFADLDINTFIDKTGLNLLYEKSIVFGITQAALIVPIATMPPEKKEEIYCNPETSAKANVVSRSEEFIEIARENKKYHDRVLELFDEIIERYIYSS